MRYLGIEQLAASHGWLVGNVDVYEIQTVAVCTIQVPRTVNDKLRPSCLSRAIH